MVKFKLPYNPSGSDADPPTKNVRLSWQGLFGTLVPILPKSGTNRYWNL